MWFNPRTNMIQWTPTPEQIGLHAVSVQVTDGRGGYDGQTYAPRVVEPGAGTISGYAVDDANRNGVQDPDETFLANRTVWLDQNRNGVLDAGERQTQTDANGYYVFDELPSDAYCVRFAAEEGWIQTFPTEGEWGPGDNVVNGDFGYG